MTIDYYRLVTDKIGEFSNLVNRMDEDKDLIRLKDFTLVDPDDKNAPDVDNVTLNGPMIFFNRVCNTLIAANMQTEVTGEGLEDKETTLIEDFFRDILLGADERLLWRGIHGLMPFNIQQACGRGRMSTRVTLRMDGEKFIPDVLPNDSRRVVYEHGVEGLKWVAPQYHRSKAQILDQYGIEVNTTTAIVTDFFDDELERIFIDDQLANEKKHPYGCVPFVITLCPAGIMFQDEDMVALEGESILAPDRKLWTEINKLASILMTLTVQSFYGGLQYESEDGRRAKQPVLPPYGKKVVVPVDKGTKGYFSMPVNDVRNATRWLYEMLSSALQKGSLPEVSYGSLSFPLSAVAVKSLAQAEDPIYLPRMQGLAIHNQSICRMLQQQYVMLGVNAKLGEIGAQKEYSYRDLDKEFSIKFRFFANSPTQDIANISMASAARNVGYSDDTIRRTILKMENPDGEKMKRRAEEAERLDPALMLFNQGHSLIDAERYIEAELVLQSLERMLRQRAMAGTMPQLPMPEKTKESNPGRELMPLLDQSGGRAKVPAEQLPGGEAEE